MCNCRRVGLPAPLNYDQGKMEEEMGDDELLNLVGGDDSKKKKHTWESVAKERISKINDNEDQKRAFDRIMNAVHSKQGDRLFFLEGPGGCGKTFIYNTLIAQLRHEKRSVIACASTGIAALLLMGGSTAHRAFRIPEDVNREMPSRYAWEKDDAKRIRNAEVLIIDEVSMLHRDVLDFIDRTLQDLQPRDEEKLPFGGKVVLLGGDWKQLLPVVPGIDNLNSDLKFVFLISKYFQENRLGSRYLLA